jgi:hypothetical protein
MTDFKKIPTDEEVQRDIERTRAELLVEAMNAIQIHDDRNRNGNYDQPFGTDAMVRCRREQSRTGSELFWGPDQRTYHQRSSATWSRTRNLGSAWR